MLSKLSFTKTTSIVVIKFMSNGKKQKPDLRTYLNIHHYLEELYKYRKENEPQFSYEQWSQELDFKNRSYLRQIVIGRRAVTEVMAKQLAQRLNLQGIESEYFLLLASYSRARSQTQRNAYGSQLMRLLKSDYEQIEVENYYEFTSKTLYPKLQTLLSFRDIDKTPAVLAKLLKISETEVEEALGTLQRIQLAKKESDQRWKSLNRAFTVPDVIGDISLLAYHGQSLQEAIKARELPKEERRYSSLLLPLSQEELTTFIAELNRFSKEMLSKFDVDDLRNRRLYQVNLNIYPVSETPVEKIGEVFIEE